MTEYNDLIASELAEVAGPIHLYLEREGLFNSKGFSAMLMILAASMAHAQPLTEEDHNKAYAVLKDLESSVLSAMLAQLAKGLLMEGWKKA